MTEGEIRQRIRSALLDKRGSDLILALVEEIVHVNIQTELALRQIQALKSYESLKDQLIALDTAKTKDPRPKSLRLDASQLLSSADGFHNLEYSQEGTPYRWTGPSREFSFNVFVSRVRPIEVALRATKLREPELQSELVLIVDGEPMNLKFERDDRKWVVRTVLPARADIGATHLTFVAASVDSPSDSVDTRLLGIAFHELEIRPAPEVEDPRPAPAPMMNGSAPVVPLANNQSVPAAATLAATARPRKAGILGTRGSH